MMQLTAQQEQRQLSEILRNKGFICFDFLRGGTCTRQNCPYMHIADGEERPVPESVCLFFHQSVCLREKCKFFHGPKADLDVLRASGRTTYRPQDYMKIAVPPSELAAAPSSAPTKGIIPAASAVSATALPTASIGQTIHPAPLPNIVPWLNQASANVLAPQQPPLFQFIQTTLPHQQQQQPSSLFTALPPGMASTNVVWVAPSQPFQQTMQPVLYSYGPQMMLPTATPAFIAPNFVAQ